MDDIRHLLSLDPEAEVGERGPIPKRRSRLTGRSAALGVGLVATALVCFFVGQRVSRFGESKHSVELDTEVERLFATAGDSEKPSLENKLKSLLGHDAVDRLRRKKTAPMVEEAFSNKYDAVLRSKMAAGHGKVAGCQSESYHLQSVFVLHKEFGSEPAGARAVQVLSDTEHAVSCGSDGICWVFDIASGTPIQAFPDHTGPVNSISVLNDAVYILTAGDDGNGKGQAYMWDWRHGFRFKAFTCADGPYMSSAEFPAWRIYGLGCADNFTTLYNWDTGTSVRLPFNSRTTQEVKARIQGMINAYKNTRLNGIERLAAELAGQHAKFVEDLIIASNPELAETEMVGENTYNFFHKNNFGAVNAMAYVPTRLRFATGHEDGKVRYWSAQTGMLLMAMKGHTGKVNALAPTPTQQDALSGGEDGTVRVWDLKTGEQKQLLYQPSGGPVYSVAVFPDGKRAVVGSDDGNLRVWDIENGVQLCKIEGAGGAIRGIAINPSNPAGQILAASDDGYVRVYNPKQ